jgi:branched-chain amino acid transport system substrate-binding protein
VSLPRLLAILSDRSLVPAWLVVPAVLILGGCRNQPGDVATSRGGEYAIGVALNPQRPGMHTIYRGVELAVDQLNRERGGKGARISMRRTPENLTGAVDIAAFLRDDPTVVGVVGHPESGSTLDAAAIYEDSERGGARALVAVSPTATSPALSGRSEWIFRVCPTDIAASAAAARYALDSLGARRASIIYRNDPYGKDWTRAFGIAFRAGGGTVLHRDPYLAGITEWDAYAAYIAKLGPDIVLFPGSAEDAELAIRALRAAGVRAPVLGGDAIAPLQAKAEEFSGVRYAAFFQPEAVTSDAGRAFVQAYRTKHGELPDQRAALAYDAAMIIGRAALAARGDRARTRDMIAAIGSSPNAVHQGATGRIAFDARHDVVGKAVVIARVGRR